MAGYHVSSLKPNEVSLSLRSGTFALRWVEDNNKSSAPIAVNLSVDSKAFYLICLNKITKETECFDIALIHDTRTGTEALLPRGAAECEHNNIGVLDVPLNSKWMTIYYGNTFIPYRDLRIVHFCFPSPTIAREWTEQLFFYSRNPLLRNPSGLDCLEKVHIKIIHSLIEDRSDKKILPVRSLIQFLCKNTRDANKETKILKALELLELPCRTEAIIDPDQFTFNKFFRFYMQLMERHEIDKLFESAGAKHRRYLTCDKIREFILKQNDGHGDAFGIDYYYKKAEDLLRKYTQHDKKFLQKGMSDESFLRYLLSFDNLIVDPSKFDLYMDMDKPLAHYFISSSHNTYLTGSQLTGRASAEMYRQVLLSGCRCIELDVVDSEKKNDEPEIKHRNTPVRSVPFVQVIQAIKDTAFKASPYPVILSLENHCNPKAQARMAKYLVDIFGDYLVTQPLRTHPCEENCPLPSPNDLKYKILIKNKKLHQTPTNNVNNVNGAIAIRKTDSIVTTNSDQSSGTIGLLHPSTTLPCLSNVSNEMSSQKQASLNEIRDNIQTIEFYQQLPPENSRSNILIEEDLSSSTDDEDLTAPVNETNIEEISPMDSTLINNENIRYSKHNNVQTESKATKAMSDLVHYLVPVRFVNFVRAEERKRSYEISSFPEDRAQNLIRDYAREFLAYNQRQLSRIYPRGTRFDSSNYNPYTFWPVGCQLVALNYQTLDTPMQVNLGLFAYNGACGYIGKPASLCQSRGSFDPKCRNSVENVVVYQIEIKIISGQFLCQDREPTYVDVEMYGMYADTTKRHEYRSRAKRWNGFQAIYDDSDVGSGDFSIRFSKVILPEMASLRFAVSEEDGTFIGQSLIPVAHLRAGYRHVVLRNQTNVAVNPSTLFIYIRKNVHVDEENRDLIEQLVSPTTTSSTNKEISKPFRSKTLTGQRSHSISDLNSMREKGKSISISTTDESTFSPTETMTHQYPSSSEINQAVDYRKKRNPSMGFADTNFSQNQLIGWSQLNDQTRLCRILPIEEFEATKEYRKKYEKIQAKIKKSTLENDKKIQLEEERFEKCLERQKNGSMSPLKRRVIGNDSLNLVHSDGRTTSFTYQNVIYEEIKQSETRLLDLYSEKFHLQNKVEYKQAKEFYNELERQVTNFYEKQLSKINSILKKEKSKVKEDVRLQTQTETNRTIQTEKDAGKILNLKEKIRQINIEAGVLTIRKLQEMHGDLTKTIRSNWEKTRFEVQKVKDLETKNRFNKYSNQLNEVKVRLSRSINWENPERSNEGNSSGYYRCSFTSSSLSAILDQPARSANSNLDKDSSSNDDRETSRTKSISNNSNEDFHSSDTIVESTRL